MLDQFYVIGYHADKGGYKGILTPEHVTIEELLKHLLNIGIVASNVSKEKYDNFDPSQINHIDLVGNTEEGELNL